MAAPKIEKLLTPYNFTSMGDTGRIKYIVIHYVGALGGAENNCKYYAGRYLGASAHYFVGFEGEIWQSVEDGDIAWHCGAKSYKHAECRNSNSIGIELCVRNKGSQAADSRDWYFESATVRSAIELTGYLMRKYGIDADHVIRHHDVTGKICPNPYVYNNTEHTWDIFKRSIAGGEAPETEDSRENMTRITGKAEATAGQMQEYIRAKNGSVPQGVIDMIPFYLSEGEAENIRGDIAFAQSCLETGNFTFEGSAVELSQNNFCGHGVTKRGEKGNSFETPQLGIRAQIQHLKAYANKAKLKQECVDPRFTLVSRGCAPYVEHLGIQENPEGRGWAAGAGYGGRILKILSSIMEGPAPEIPDSAGMEGPDPGQGDAFHPYTVTTTCDLLNIRTGAGSFYPVSGAIREKNGQKKQYTIIEEKDGWGRLKSGAGWISLACTEKAS